MKNGYGVFIQYDSGRTICVAATDSFTHAQAMHGKLRFYINARGAFKVGPDSAGSPEDRQLFEHFEKLERKYGSARVLRDGVGEILLYVKEA